MRCACIDIGSNTTRLLVAEPVAGALQEILSQRAFTRLPAGREIPQEKIVLVAGIVASQVRMAQECGAAHIRTVATAAIREAPNRAVLCEAVAREAGVTVEILTGTQEAKLAFTGATRTLQHAPLGTVAVIDVGGGSSEIVVGTMADGVTWSASFRVGSGFLADHYISGDPPSPAELDTIRHHVAGVFEGLDVPPAQVAYAVGGSATSLRRMIGAELSHDTLTRGLRVIGQSSVEELAQRFELHPERARVLPAGMLLLDEIVRTIDQPLRIASGGLREGVLLDAIAAHGAV